MKASKLLLTLITIFTVLLLAACGGNEDKEKETAEQPKEKEETSYTVEHAMGSTTLEKTPEKVVILTNEGTEALLALGVTPVGAVQSWTGDLWYDHIADEMKDVQVVGVESQVNVEAIAALQPDLIIGNKMRQEDIYEQLKAIAPTVFAEDLRGNWKNNFELYAKAVNKEEKGKEVLAAYDQRIEDLKEKLGDKVNMEVSMVRFMAGDVRIYHKDSFSGVILEQIGMARPESQDKEDFAEKGVTKERIPAMDGDILFYFTYDEGDGKATEVEKEWIEDPLFQNLEVAKKGEVHKVNDAIWNTAGGVKAANLMLDDLEKHLLK
ncbi:ABC transporter substrate-binding protein [Mesobacillus selenatarsenatis]|uniref:ABC-type Fe3+-siderophore transport system, periplasmic iron-binding component n=1 Tax=Mesobacillus selenatarsenatis (strain DSM 18680 / JCM 14380 / FERM P-15431 / SF-1) TaxID=1321606 RepID=A0A0A8X506_MESS1|nr:iron-siderophore ABC transporter substrate-binding protein [Mesobacillus selenatarsenatis]GAM14329.1 ABC-type Fe3+-siderophore transport system, periplasmic iron-binding component [Mesobacillus selenatarsenatis SF-1]